MRAVGFRGLLMPLGLGLVVIGIGGCTRGNDSLSVASPPVPTGDINVEAASRYVLTDSASMSLLDAQVAGPVDPDLLAGWAFSVQGSPDDDEEPRPGLLFFDAAGAMFEAVRAQGTEIDAGGRTFWWLTEAENQRIYAGPPPQERRSA